MRNVHRISYLVIGALFTGGVACSYPTDANLKENVSTHNVYCDTTALNNGIRQDVVYEDKAKTLPLYVKTIFADGSYAVQRLGEGGIVVTTELFDRFGKKLLK